MNNQNDSCKKGDKPPYVLVLNFCLLLSSVGLLALVIYLTQIQRIHKSKLANFEIEMNQRNKLAELMSKASAGTKYNNLVKNKFGFWEDKDGFVYDIEFDMNSSIEVITPLGKLNAKKQLALQQERQRKKEKIQYHTKELENLGVKIGKEKSREAGMPMFDGLNVKQAMDFHKKILNGTENGKDKNGS